MLGIEIIGDGSLDDRFDLFIGTLGYETRSSHLARHGQINACRKIALAFPEEDYAAYLSNRDFLNEAKFEILPKDTGEFSKVLATSIENHPTDEKRDFSILVDISSMSRPMLADIVYQLSMVERVAGMRVTFVYLPAEFVRENAEHAPVAVTEPVTPDYAGWTSTPERPITAVVGLGYEHDLALGTIEYLEPTSVWVFVPTGEDRRYDDAVNQANRDLKEMLRDERVMNYYVDAPARVHAILENLVFGLLQSSRTVLVPFGPKIFSLCCLLVARTYAPEITVWRVSGETFAKPGDRIASGKVVTLQTRFARR
ncbi:hypothetical protein [Hephaestia mangrovi]|uniref:hypothetical protein n=1 Tax=Hephaestia mangrovi TaxID=2873268 RepID=UPI001CA7824E|nr:hypothetical protein [Hephaestia mangrovi]MBY8828535.1 hypothetical protein [Hephaestia mangrovi]